MTPREKYIQALIALMGAQQEVQADESNPFNLGMPSHVALADDTFITHADMEHLKTEVQRASVSNEKFEKLWGVGRTLTNVIKTFI